MKIISKHKDYYDYYQGIFGSDNKRVFKRSNYVFNNQFIPRFTSHGYTVIVFAINHLLYFMYQDEKGVHPVSRGIYEKEGRFGRDLTNGIPTDINKKFRKPVVKGEYRYGKIEWEEGDPILSSFGFHKVLTDRIVYIEVETFLGWLVDNPPLPDNQTNKEKITGHGFDLKKSFRHRK